MCCDLTEPDEGNGENEKKEKRIGKEWESSQNKKGPKPNAHSEKQEVTV